MGTENSPAWVVYNQLRTARLNVKYYECKLQTAERLDKVMEGVLAVTAPGSAVAGLSFWKYGVGVNIWSVLGVIAAVVAAARPVIGVTKRVRALERLVQGYRLLDFDLRSIRNAIEQKQVYGPTLQAQFQKAEQREKELISSSIEPKPNKKLLHRCMDEVEQELPVEGFYIPPEESNEHTRQTT